MDPESGLDAIRNIGISAGVIKAISAEPLAGRLVIDATGLVVAPGFIDLQWNMPPEYQRVQLLDGVTMALKTWLGTDDVDRWYAEREGRALMNFGVSVGHPPIRMAVMDDPGHLLPTGDAHRRTATDSEISEMRQKIDRGLRRGAVAVAFSYIVTPAASGWEALETFRAAAGAGSPVNGTIRGVSWDVDDMPRFVTEIIGAAAMTGAALHLVHIQASGGPHTPRLLRIIEEARQRGLDVTAEMFPYSSNITNLRLLGADDWRGWPDDEFRDFESMQTGERLTRESYARHLEQDALVIVHNEYLGPIIAETVASPITMIGSGAFLDEQGHGHPRASGTHARILGRYVREERVLSLMEALRKMTLMPAQRFERRVPAMKNKGRIREGADADIVVFDANRIIDRATFPEPTHPSDGMVHVLVNGVVGVRDGAVQEGIYPGQAVRAPIGVDSERDTRP